MRILVIVVFFIVNILNIQAENKEVGEKEITDFIAYIFLNNDQHVKDTGYDYFKDFIEVQNPRVTVVKCADSRVQTSAFDNNRAAGDMFIIRNIGNQIETAKGSIEYGVRHLHTPVLLIIGHSNCGAIKAASEDFSGESTSIQKELASLKLNTKDLNHAIVENVHHQVDVATEMFQDLIDEKKLIVIGAIYDFKDDFKRGYGRLILVNFNSEKDARKIRNSNYFKHIREIPIGIPD